VEKTGGQTGGFFVEIGGYDGLRHSNTLALEESFGWTGLLVEPNPLLYPKLIEQRPNVECDEIAIGPEAGTKVFIVGDAFGGLVDYMPPDWLEEHERRANRKIQVPVITLLQLFTRHAVPCVIDYLSLDVEGAEYVILEQYLRENSFPAIRFMTVEFREREQLHPLCKLLAPYFHLDKVQAWDAFFVNKVLA